MPCDPTIITYSWVRATNYTIGPTIQYLIEPINSHLLFLYSNFNNMYLT